jgi:hypothetical protein
MDLSEEKINQYRERPKKHIIYPIRHGVLFLVLRSVGHMFVDFLLPRHFLGLTTMGWMESPGDVFWK